MINAPTTGWRNQLGKEQWCPIFEDKKVRTLWDAEQEKWYLSIVDVIAVLTESIDPNAYWRKLKQRLKAEGNKTVTNCHGLKMQAPDGKMRMTDVECKIGFGIAGWNKKIKLFVSSIAYFSVLS